MKNYVSKLNDRNLQRKRESGLTTYALYSVIVILIYQLICLYPKLPFKTSFLEILEISSYTFSILLFVLMILAVYGLTTGHQSSLRIISHNQKQFLFEQLIVIGHFLFLLSINLYNLWVSVNIKESLDVYFLSMSLIYMLLFIGIIVKNSNRNINHSYKVFEGTGRQDTDKDFPSILMYALSFVIIAFSVYYLFNSPIIRKFNIVLFSALLYFIFIIGDKIILLRKNDGFTTALENLEYEINMKNLTDPEIRERLQKKYMGFLLGDWIIHNLELLSSFMNNLDNEKREIAILKERLGKIDSVKYKFEYEGRLKIITDKEKKVDKDNNTFINQKLNEIEGIWKNSNIKPEDRAELSNLYNKLKKYLLK